EKGEQRENVFLVQGRLAVEGIVLVTAKGGAGVVVYVVADETDFVVELEGAHRLLKEEIAGPVVADDIESGGAFWGAVFHVAHVDINTATVEEKTAVAGRFIPIAVVQVNEPIA